MFKRVFSPKRIEGFSKSIRVPKPMLELLEKLAAEHGETLNAYIVLVLDEHLQGLVKQGKIKAPAA